MGRTEEIADASIQFMERGGDSDAFIEGAVWADETNDARVGLLELKLAAAISALKTLEAASPYHFIARNALIEIEEMK